MVAGNGEALDLGMIGRSTAKTITSWVNPQSGLRVRDWSEFWDRKAKCSMNNERKRILRELQRQGWQVIKNHGHFRLIPPGGGMPVWASQSPGDVIAERQLIRDLRKRGVEIKGRQ
jgi:hypothetical protein